MILLTVLVLTLSQTPQATPSPATVDEILAASARDFRANHSPAPAEFRNVRAGHIDHEDGRRQLFLCGESLLADQGEARWTPFATVQTAGYEQWLGGAAGGLCAQPTIQWRGDDFTADLKAEVARAD